MRSLLTLMVATALMAGAIGCKNTGETIEGEGCSSCASCAGSSGTPVSPVPTSSTGTISSPIMGSNPTPQILNEMPKMQEPPLKQF